MRLRQDGGAELGGYADMVVMSDESFVLVNHKCLSGTREEARGPACLIEPRVLRA